MKLFLTIFLLLILLSTLFIGCSFTGPIIIPTTIPADMQQLIKSTKVESVDYSFTPNDKADLISFKQTSGAAIFYRELHLNSAIKPLLDELIQTKFSKISKDSDWKVNVIIQDVSYNSDEPNSLSLTVKTIVSNKSKQSEKKLNYSISFGFLSDETSLIHSFLMKYIIGVDKFLDNEFEVQ